MSSRCSCAQAIHVRVLIRTYIYIYYFIYKFYISTYLYFIRTKISYHLYVEAKRGISKICLFLQWTNGIGTTENCCDFLKSTRKCGNVDPIFSLPWKLLWWLSKPSLEFSCRKLVKYNRLFKTGNGNDLH